jgi:hypothetical protein
LDLNENLEKFAKLANTLAGHGNPVLAQIGLSLLIVAALLAVGAGVLAVGAVIPGVPVLLPLLAAHCGFGLTHAIIAGTALSATTAGTLAGLTVAAVPTTAIAL